MNSFQKAEGKSILEPSPVKAARPQLHPRLPLLTFKKCNICALLSLGRLSLVGSQL